MQKIIPVFLALLFAIPATAERGNDARLNSSLLRLALSIENLDTTEKIWLGETLSSGANFQATIESNGIDCVGGWHISAVGDPSVGAPPSVTVATGSLALGPDAGVNTIVLPVLFAGVTPDGTNNWKLSAYCNGAERKQVAFEFFEFFVNQN